ncbi:MAG: aspartate kinase, partial [Defluviitaleaceae bacterium]|nr:aspartate kinase [Defluviitaleaceae bacterium]
MLVVMKFGGSSLADVSLIENAAGQIRDMAASGARVVVALSAMGKTTNDLLALADSVNPKASRRELDMLLSIGEQQSVALMAMALQKMGLQAISLNARQAGISASSIHFNARIKNIDTYRINSELDRGQVVIVAGFQGVNRHDDVVTLGRGSGDVTAVALAAALNADECRIYTDVDGIFTADPRIVPDAKRLAVIGYDEMIEMAALGAKVLQ